MVLSIHSCKRIGDDDGNLLVDMDANQGGLGKDRFLYQEVTSADTVAGYFYNQRNLAKVIGDSTITNITYSGSLINKIEFNGVIEGDSISYSQLFNYDATNNNRISYITETKSVYADIAAQIAPLTFTKSKSLYDLKYNTAGKLEEVTKKSGDEIPLQTFVFTSYLQTAYTYDALWNVTKNTIKAGGISGGVLQTASENMTFEYSNYDDKINPAQLLPFGYILHKSFENSFNNYRFSPNNPKRVVYTSDLVPLPLTFNTLYTYDALGYALSGFGINYEYRPF